MRRGGYRYQRRRSRAAGGQDAQAGAAGSAHGGQGWRISWCWGRSWRRDHDLRDEGAKMGRTTPDGHLGFGDLFVRAVQPWCSGAIGANRPTSPGRAETDLRTAQRSPTSSRAAPSASRPSLANEIELNDGNTVSYDYLHHLHRSRPRLRRNRASAPRATRLGLHDPTRRKPPKSGAPSSPIPRPSSSARCRARSLLRPRLRIRLHHGNRPAPPQDARPRAHDLRDARAYIGHLGLDGVSDTKTMLETARDKHIKWITNARS